MVLAFALGCISSALAQPTPLLPDPPAPPIPVEQMRAFGYTKEFAKRFALPEPKPAWEPGEGLLAVEFRVEPIPGPRGLYGCDFRLYLDSRLDLHPSLATGGSRVVGDGRDTHHGGDLASIQPPELRQFGDQCRTGDRADPAGRTQQGVELGEVRSDMAGHLCFHVIQLGADGLDHRLDARTHHGNRQVQPLCGTSFRV